jgi:hypothetical protein
MLLFSQIISEGRIQQAITEGKFDNLEGRGKPLPPDEAQKLPPELRMAYRMLKSSGHLPPEILEEREINNAIDLLSAMTDEGQRYRQMQKLNIMIMKMNERRGRPVNLEAEDDYYRRIVEKVKVAEAKAAEKK